MTEISLQVSETVAVTLDVGEQGETGLTGAQGETGLTGADSVVAGPIGLTGLTGLTGETGIVEQATPPADVSVLWLDSSADAVPVDLSGVEPAGLSDETKTELSAAYAGLARRDAFSSLTTMLESGIESGTINVVGDSTGNDSNEWVWLLAQSLAAKYPAYTVDHSLWNTTKQNYDPRSRIQAGTAGPLRMTIATTGYGSFPLGGTGTISVTGDLEIVAEVTPTTWTPSGDQCLAAHFGNAGERAFVFMLRTSGKLQFYWSADGTTTVGYPESTAPIGASAGTKLFVKMKFTVDN
jgi:hypothetical protein